MNMKNVQKLMKAFDLNLDLYERPEYKITERNRLSYIVHNLEAEYECGSLYFGDDENIMLIKNSMLNELRSELVKDIIVQNGKYVIMLSKELGQINIELVN